MVGRHTLEGISRADPQTRTSALWLRLGSIRWLDCAWPGPRPNCCRVPSTRLHGHRRRVSAATCFWDHSRVVSAPRTHRRSAKMCEGFGYREVNTLMLYLQFYCPPSCGLNSVGSCRQSVESNSRRQVCRAVCAPNWCRWACGRFGICKGVMQLRRALLDWLDVTYFEKSRKAMWPW